MDTRINEITSKSFEKTSWKKMAPDCKTLKILDAQAYSIWVNQNIWIWNTVISIF